MLDDESQAMLERYRAGDEAAAAEIYDRYVDRLIALARSRLSQRLVRRAGPEDIVQSAYRSFFSGVRKGQFEIAEGQKLWSLLAKILERIVAEPTPEEAVEITELLRGVMEGLTAADAGIASAGKERGGSRCRHGTCDKNRAAATQESGGRTHSQAYRRRK